MNNRHFILLFAIVFSVFLLSLQQPLYFIKRKDIFILISLKKNTSHLISPVIHIHLNTLFMPM